MVVRATTRGLGSEGLAPRVASPAVRGSMGQALGNRLVRHRALLLSSLFSTAALAPAGAQAVKEQQPGAREALEPLLTGEMVDRCLPPVAPAGVDLPANPPRNEPAPQGKQAAVAAAASHKRAEDLLAALRARSCVAAETNREQVALMVAATRLQAEDRVGREALDGAHRLLEERHAALREALREYVAAVSDARYARVDEIRRELEEVLRRR
jgi:hypothetical protein